MMLVNKFISFTITRKDCINLKNSNKIKFGHENSKNKHSGMNGLP